MKRALAYVLMLCVLASAAVSCGHSRERRIPRAKMARIYADMFMADQWAVDNHLKQSADTLQFYEAVFEKYGCDSRDFRYSMQYYLKDPLRYSRIIKKSVSILEARRSEVRAAIARQEKARSDSLAAELAPRPENIIPEQKDSVKVKKIKSK